MKTIYTSLPIYDRKSKQCFERARKSETAYQSSDPPVPIICPRHRLPSFQWNAEADDMGAVTKVEYLDSTGERATIATSLTNGALYGAYDTFTVAGTAITSAINAAGTAGAKINPTFSVVKSEVITVEFTLTWTSGEYPYFAIVGAASNGMYVQATNGVNTLYIVSSEAYAAAYIWIFNTGAANWAVTAITVKRGNITSSFPTLPAATVLTTDTYYTYEGDTLKWLLPEGFYYLKITTANAYTLYSDWFHVTCVYKNLITGWSNYSFGTFSSNGVVITSATDAGAGAAISNDTYFSVSMDEVIRVVIWVGSNTGALPSITIVDSGLNAKSIAYDLVDGINDIEITIIGATDTAQLFLATAGATNFYTEEVMVFRNYSEQYLTIEYYNTCDIGDLLYAEGLTQTIWFESETMEQSFSQEEEGANNGDNQFVRSFARQVKKYVARTKDMPSFMVDVFNRMKLHDTVSLTDLVGDVNSVYNLEVTHEWMDNDKYYAIIVLTFDYDEAFVIAGCCNNLT